jgi:hypothetical protein
MIGYVALSMGKARLAAEHLQAASASGSFASIHERLVSDARAAAEHVVGRERN